MTNEPIKNKNVLLTVLFAILLISAVSTCSNRVQSISAQQESPEPVIEKSPEEDFVDGQNPEPAIYCSCVPPAYTLAHQEETPPAAETLNSKTPANAFVAGVSPMFGDFIYGWGSGSQDEPVKTLTNGYRDTYVVTGDGRFELNKSVVCKLDTEFDEDWNKTYTFTLHSHLKWNNGEPLTARDYVAGILTYASYKFGQAGGKSDIGAGLLGYETYHTGTVAPYFSGIRLIDDYTFSATVSAEFLPYFWETSYVTFKPLYMSGWYPDNEIQTGDYGSRFVFSIADDLTRIYETQRSAPSVTCGPYRFAHYDETELVLERNEYFGVCNDGYSPYFNIIIQKVIPEDRAIEMLWAGEIDYISNIDSREIGRMREEMSRDPDNTDGNPGGSPDITDSEDTEPADLLQPENYIKTHQYIRAGYGFIEFALDIPPADNYNVRLATAHIIDRDMLIEQAFDGNAITVDGAYSPAQWTYRIRQNELETALLQKSYNPAEANRLLDETGWVYESDGETPFDPGQTSIDGLYLRHNSEGEVLHIAVASGSAIPALELENSARMNASLAGMKFTVEQIDIPQLLEHYHNGKTMPPETRKFNAFQLAYDFTLIDDKFWLYHSSLAETGLNSNGVSDEILDEIIMAMRSLEPEQTEQFADLWVDFQIRRQELLPAFPLYVNIYCDAMSTVVTQVPATAYAGYQDVVMHIAKYS